MPYWTIGSNKFVSTVSHLVAPFDTFLHCINSIKGCYSTVNPTSPTVYVVNVSVGVIQRMGLGAVYPTSRYMLEPLEGVCSSQRMSAAVFWAGHIGHCESRLSTVCVNADVG